MKNKNIIGHLSALLTILIWGTTFISTKILLTDFKPVEILFLRFVLGFFALLVIAPKHMKCTDIKQELTFMVAGLCGICLYYLLENISLTYTMASNVGVIISTAPFFTGLLTKLFFKKDNELNKNFFIGFAIAMAGVILLSFNGAKLKLNPIGDILAICASFVWACYSILTKKISELGFPVILATRRTFFYGIIFMVPAMFLFNFDVNVPKIITSQNLIHMLYLGLGASALCFVTWNIAVKSLGAVKTSIYIYIVPVVTVITSAIMLKEPISIISVIGTLLAITGLFASEYKRN